MLRPRRHRRNGGQRDRDTHPIWRPRRTAAECFLPSLPLLRADLCWFFRFFFFFLLSVYELFVWFFLQFLVLRFSGDFREINRGFRLLRFFACLFVWWEFRKENWGETTTLGLGPVIGLSSKLLGLVFQVGPYLIRAEFVW